MQRHTEAYVRNVLFAGKHLPSRLNRRFYPTRRDYSNMIYRARLSETFSCIDEDNLVEKLKVWSERLPDQSFYFRKCVNSSESDLQVDSDGNILICSRGKTGLLFIHQTAWQRSCWQSTVDCVYLTLLIVRHATLCHSSSSVSRRMLTMWSLQHLSRSLKTVPALLKHCKC